VPQSEWLAAGRMGSIHARLIARSVPEALLVGIADVNLPAAQRLAGELGGPPAFGSLDEMLAAPGAPGRPHRDLLEPPSRGDQRCRARGQGHPL
jgi:hypothetical protein